MVQLDIGALVMVTPEQERLQQMPVKKKADISVQKSPVLAIAKILFALILSLIVETYL